MKTYYEVLGININATPSELAVAYRKMAFKTHPDKNPGIDTKFFIQVQSAYETLIDDSRRANYDAKIKKMGYVSSQTSSAQQPQATQRTASAQSQSSQTGSKIPSNGDIAKNFRQGVKSEEDERWDKIFKSFENSNYCQYSNKAKQRRAENDEILRRANYNNAQNSF